MSDVIEFQKRINAAIPVTDCIAYVKEVVVSVDENGCIDISINDDQKKTDRVIYEKVYKVTFDFIRLKQKVEKTVPSCNLSEDAINRLIFSVGKEVLEEMQQKQASAG